MDDVDDDASHMGLALRLARSGTGATYPNPCVGAVVVKDGRVVGSACSDRTGGDHAEVRALRAAGANTRGATVYVTLEPCSHTGRTPPCTDALRKAGVSEVVWGVDDPAAHARGKAAAELTSAGIGVRRGVMLEHCARVHEHYLHHERTGRPFVSLKTAASLDGRVACASGDSRWITGIEARRYVHQMRAQHHAIAIGVGTLLADNPQLNVRHVEGVDPKPVIFDSQLRSAAHIGQLKLLRPGTLILHTGTAVVTARTALERVGCELAEIAADSNGRVDIAAALAYLGTQNIRSVMVEGGPTLMSAIILSQSWQRWFLLHAPVILGDGMPVLPGLSWPTVKQAPHLGVSARETLGVDLLTILSPGTG
ncbi:MAG: bifunctional diaminohydroxyphosphoribosylaminopyrimidine deaminase/5-amino-6-(5-phosphoribosylamino)uracil reductase RibD [Nannocystaceae bacterium]